MYAAAEAIGGDSELSTSEVCDVLEVSRSAFYAWKLASPTIKERQDHNLMPQVKAIFYRHRRRYGTRRIVMELRDREILCGRRRVAKLMKSQGLRAIQPKSFKPRGTESLSHRGRPLGEQQRRWWRIESLQSSDCSDDELHRRDRPITYVAVVKEPLRTQHSFTVQNRG